MKTLLLGLFVFLLASGQMLFKKAALTIEVAHISSWLFNGWLYTALTLYMLATILWIWILQDMPLSQAYPFVALGFAIVPLGAWWFFGETIDFRHVLGTIFIISGILVIAT
jgi:undecaprenyl phosphate-alpha-L-ara4N flippase subunit ArnE